ncbi:MAG: AmmeMemoRadiSam system protein A [bacterium]
MSSYIYLAKLAVETYILNGVTINPPFPIPQEFTKHNGVFVTIESHSKLRGCVGTYQPIKENLALEIIDNAISAAVNDYRFSKIKKDELGDLSYAVYVLNPPEKIDNKSELNPKKYGVVVKGASSGRTGLLLPDLDGINGINEQISIAVQKAGINLEKEKIILYRFTAEKYSD